MSSVLEYLSGSHDEELCVLVAEEIGYKINREGYGTGEWKTPEGNWCRNQSWNKLCLNRTPEFSTSRDACRELIEDCGEELTTYLRKIVGEKDMKFNTVCTRLLRATPRQICVSYLIVKGVLK